MIKMTTPAEDLCGYLLSVGPHEVETIVFVKVIRHNYKKQDLKHKN